MDLVILTMVLVVLTAVLLVAAILSTISSVKLKRAIDKLAKIQLSLANAQMTRTLEVPREWLTGNMDAFEKLLKEVFPQGEFYHALKKGMKFEELERIRQKTKPIKWSLDEDNLIITFPINRASEMLELLLIEAREPEKIKDLIHKGYLTGLLLEKRGEV